MAKKTLVSFVGRQGAGKSTIAGALAEALKTAHVETSDVVKDLYAGLPREMLASTGRRTQEDPDWLGIAVHRTLIDKMRVYERNIVVLSGVREHQVHDYLGKHFDLYPFEVVAEPELRYQRVLGLMKVANGKQFIEHELRETELGVQEVMDKAPFRIPTTEDTQPEYIVRAVLRALSIKGVELG